MGDAGGGLKDEASPPMAANRPLTFIVLCYALSVAFWLLGALWTRPLLPGLPSTALMFVCPVGAAAILAGRRGGWGAVATLLARAVDYRRIRPWSLACGLIVLPIIAAILAWWAIRLSGAPIPPPSFSISHAVLLTLFMFVAAICEEIGWSGWLTEPFVARFGVLGAGLAIGLVWAVFHYVALLQIHRSLDWIAWWSLGTVATRVVMVQLYERAGRSVFAVSLLHLLGNLGWQLFPGDGAWFNPAVNGVIMTILAGAVVVFGRFRGAR
jgi:membrane protease YdiL (CAAX protease family)